MGNSPSSSNNKPKNNSAQIDQLIANPNTPLNVLIQARNFVHKKKSNVSSYEQRALTAIANSMKRSNKADEQYKKLNQAINKNINNKRRQITRST